MRDSFALATVRESGVLMHGPEGLDGLEQGNTKKVRRRRKVRKRR
jgi:hypothetical protein